MNEIEFERFKETEEYNDCLKSLDGSIRARLIKRLDKYKEDKKLPNTAGFLQKADGIGEIRFDFGPGYRIYFCQYRRMILLLLMGGRKNTQPTDIANARAIKDREIKKLESERG